MTSETRTSLHIYHTWYFNSIIYSIIATYLVLHEKKEQFGKYQKPDLHIIIQCYMFYIREWMTKIKKMVCGKIEYVLIIFFVILLIDFAEDVENELKLFWKTHSTKTTIHFGFTIQIIETSSM